MNRVAVIVGCGGQDGRLLDAKLRQLSYSIIALRRETIDIANHGDVRRLLADATPAEVYFLATHHHSSQQLPSDELGELFRRSNTVHFIGAVNFIDAIAKVSPQTRMFYASSSLIYTPSAQLDLISEATAPNPEGAYAITKMAGMLACRHYRKSRGVFASVGILFNHESKFRGEQFLSRKIVRAAVSIKLGQSSALEIGDLDAQVDWGYAPDYVDAMHSILQLETPDDFIVATGELHTVREFADHAFSCLGLDYRNYLTVNPGKITRVNTARRGDATKLRSMCGWHPTRTFKTMVKELVHRELAAATGELSGGESDSR